MIEPFDGEPPKEELKPSKARLECDEVVETFGEIAFVDAWGQWVLKCQLKEALEVGVQEFLVGVGRKFAEHVVMYLGLIGGETLYEVVSSFGGVLALRAMRGVGWLGGMKAGRRW